MVTPLRYLMVLTVCATWLVPSAGADEQSSPQRKGLATDWKLEKDIPALVGEATDIEIPAHKLTIKVEQGWVTTRLESKDGELEWHIVVARATNPAPPKVHIDPKFGFISMEYGSFFVRETLGHLRVLRERKEEKSPAWKVPNPKVRRTLLGSAAGRLFLHEEGNWRWITAGPSEEKPDVRIRFQHKELGEDYGAQGFSDRRLGFVFCGEARCQDEGDLLIASRVPRYAAEAALLARRFQKKMGGKPAPVLVARQWFNTSGGLDLAQLKGKVVLLDFWGQWCGPCVKKLPQTEALHDKYKEKGLVVIGVHSAELSDKLDEFLKKKKITFPVMIDRGDTAKSYFVKAWPTYYLIDRTGKVAWGFANNPPSAAQIEELLNK